MSSKYQTLSRKVDRLIAALNRQNLRAERLLKIWPKFKKGMSREK